MQNEPRSFLCHGDIRSQLNRGYALLVAADKIHSHKPLNQGYLGILEDSTYGNGEGAVAMRADILSVLAYVTMVLSTIGANHITVSPTGLSNSLLAFGRRIKVEGNVYKRIEVSEVNHNKSYVSGISI